jgi:pimeloyl-ACP methyl ester carboxylesterase
MKRPEILSQVRSAPTALAIGGVAAALAAAAFVNHVVAKRSERRHPPRGRIVEVDGVRLHYLEEGEGPPVVMIHGNGVAAVDYVISGLFQRLAAHHRVIAFDRPGFGYSERPRNKVWTASTQADVLAAALDQMALGRPVVVIAHSWGTLVALRLALRRPDLVAGLGLMSGYYWPTPRLDVPMMSGPAIPVLGDVLRFTISPLIGRLIAPLIFKQIFSPAKVTGNFKAGFPTSMALRPGQLRASAGDTAMMPFEAIGLSRRYGELPCPILLIAGEGDKIASFEHQSAKLAAEIGCELHEVKGAGHMVHHIALDEVAMAIEGLMGRVEAGAPDSAALRSARGMSA